MTPLPRSTSGETDDPVTGRAPDKTPFAPSHDETRPPHILLPIDHSSPSTVALEHAFAEYPDARFTVLHVLDTAESVTYGDMIGAVNVYDQAHEHALDLLSDTQDRAREHGIELTTVTEEGAVARTITTYARDHDIDHIIMGSHGRDGISRILLGSVAEQVVRHAPVPVTVIR